MKLVPKTLSIAIFLLYLTTLPLFAQTAYLKVERERLPEIEELHARNVLFRQFVEDRKHADKQIAYGEQAELFFYRYTAKNDDTMLTLCARLMIPLETLATANALTSPDISLSGRELVLPTVPGLFLPEKAENAYEYMLQKSHSPKSEQARYTIKGRNCIFLQNERFNPTERAFFLDTNMVMPLAKHVLTSSFGYRVSPITGAWKFHSGVDLAAPVGSSVFACKTGTVTTTAYGNPIFGNYIILNHAAGMKSIYAHLSKILVKQGDTVGGGLKIGEVGTTGASTGPHLHFEIHVNGNPTDPGRLLSVD